MEKVIIYGIGDFAEDVHYYMSKDNRYDVVAFCVDEKYKNKDTFCELNVYNFENLEKKFSPETYKLFIAIGYTNMNIARMTKYEEALSKGYSLTSFIHQRAYVADNVTIGANCFIFEDVTIQPFSKIGNNVIIWSQSHLGARTYIEDHCFVSNQVSIGGAAKIRANSFIGLNSTIRDHIEVAKYSVVGAGAVILSDTEENKIYKANETQPMNYESKKIKNI